MSCKRKRDENRNCYTKTICDERLEKAQAKLQCLIDKKSQLECELERCLMEIQCIDEKIIQLECKMEKMASNQAAEECKNRMKEEISMIKDQRKKAEMKVRQYKKKICEKITRLQNCKNSDACPPSCGGGCESPEEEEEEEEDTCNPCKKTSPSSSSDSCDNDEEDDESDMCSSEDKSDDKCEDKCKRH